ncbi:MAG TPA: glycosyltransferase family 2 protein [Actinospica sp.]|nr:glycosyltransferase family 2 protein [Actinospica sp.]
MRSLSVVIPALNEAENIPAVIAAVPVARLREAGWYTEIVIVDNASTDGTGDLAASLGAKVVHQPVRGYGNAYQAGFAAVSSDVIATGDADRTYPFDALPELLAQLDEHGADFLTTNRLHAANRRAMKASHFVANHVLSATSRLLFGHSVRDSQSGMWVFRRAVWQKISVTAPGMAFSQEIKNAAIRAGFRVREVPIEYRLRGGEVKLKAYSDGWSNLRSLFAHRMSLRKRGRDAVEREAESAPTALTGAMADYAPRTAD